MADNDLISATILDIALTYINNINNPLLMVAFDINNTCMIFKYEQLNIMKAQANVQIMDDLKNKKVYLKETNDNLVFVKLQD